jgi:hypothetical protein
MRMVAPLDQLPHPGHTGGAQQLAQLGELLLIAVRDHRDQIGALAGTAPVQGRLAAGLMVSLHKS